MIDNSDIFDEADLLAIANDDESSSASVSSSSSKSSLAMTSQCHVDNIYNNNSHNNNDGAARGNNGKDVTKNDNLNDKTINNNDGNTTTNFLGDDEHKHKGKDSQSVDSSICNDYGFGTETKNGTSSTRSNGSDNDDDDDDDVADDFLKSWLDTETKNTAKTNAPSILAPHPHDEDGKENEEKGHGNSGDEIQQQQHHQLSPQIQSCHDETRNDNNLDKKHEQADSAPLNNNHGASSNDNSNDDNSSDDDENNYGFLESWSKPSNKKEKSPSETTNEEVVVAVPPLTETTPDNTAQQQEETDGNLQNNQINIHVGTSTMQWVSQYKSAKEQQQSMNHQGGRNSKGRKKVQRGNGESTTTTTFTTNASYYEHGGVVAIQNYKSRGRVNDDQVSVMCLKTLSSKRKYNNDAKKSKYGSSAVTEVAVTLESVHSPEEERVTSSGGLQQQQYYGQAVFAPEVDKTLPGTMVDCLARYDSETGCYVLEIVDLTVSNLMPQSSIGADYRTSSSDAIRKQRFGRHNVQNSNNDGVVEESGAASLTTSKSTMLDPRVRAKRAQDQVHRRLKRGKGKLGGGAGAGAQSKKQQKSVASAPDDGGGKMDVAKTANHLV